MKEALCLVLWSVFLACPSFVDSFSPLSTSEPVISGTQAPPAAAPDCRVQTC